MKFGEKIVEGIFLERPNRYLARVEINDKETLAHVQTPDVYPGCYFQIERSGLYISLVKNAKQTTHLS